MSLLINNQRQRINYKNIAMKRILIATTVAVLAISTVAMAASFGANLTVGSTGADVTALQSALIAAGYSIPAGATGYFGSQTKAAVQKYQAANGIPSTGFVGPLTRAKLNGGVAVVTTTACPAGFTCTAIGSTAPVVGSPTAISTPGVPGILSVTPGPLSTSVINVGQNMVPVLAVRNQAQYSDIAIQSVTVDLGVNTTAYNKVFAKLYVTDGTNVLASVPLNGSTVVQNGTDYVVGLAGFNFVVPKGTYRDLIIKADLYGQIDTNYRGAQTLSIPANAVRGVDGAGVSLYGPLTSMSQTITVNQSLVDNAQASVSLNAASPLVGSIPVSDTTNNQYLGLPVLIFDVYAQNDNLHLHNLAVNFAKSGTGNVTAAYLYQGSTQIMSAGVSGGVANFLNITNGTAGASIPVNTTVPYTVKADVTGVTDAASPLLITASASSTGMTIYNSIDGNAIVTGTALGNQQAVASVGPLFTLVGTPVITKQVTNTDQSGNATSTYTASFNVQVQAIGTDVNMGLPASSTPAFASTTFKIYTNQASPVTVQSLGGVVSFAQPTNTTLANSGASFIVARNATVTVPVTVSFVRANPGANTYAAQVDSINWSSVAAPAGSSNFMSGQPQWRSNSI